MAATMAQTTLNTQNISKLYLKIEKLTDNNEELTGQLEQMAEQQNALKEQFERFSKLLQHHSKQLNELREKQSEKVKKTQVVNHDEIYHKAKKELSAFNYQQAIDLFEQYIEKKPDNKSLLDSYYWLATAAFFGKQHQKASDVYRLFIKNAEVGDKRLVKAYYNGIQSDLALEKQLEAKTLLKALITHYPKHVLTKKAKTQLTE